MGETEESTKVAHNPREAMTGALAGLFGAVVLLAVVASGLVLRPPSRRAAGGAGTAPPVEMPAVASAVPSAPSASASAASLPSASAAPDRVEPLNPPDVEQASSHRRHTKGKGRKHRETTSSLRAEP